MNPRFSSTKHYKMPSITKTGLAIRGQDDPYAKIGQLNDRTQKAEKGELVSALRDINLEVQQGEMLGIIGKNRVTKGSC
jgi:lipopolysaccharide transport system ATP-binding protein